jgi:glycine betaine/proline transport system permease protein
MAINAQTLSASTVPWKQIAFWAVVLVLGLALIAFAQSQPDTFRTFPASWNFGIREPIDSFQAWVIGHRNEHPAFILFFDPISDLIDFGLRTLESFLLAMPWFVVMVFFGVLGYYFGGGRLAAICVGGLLFCGLTDLWESSMQTLALMAMSVLLSLLMGIPLGILAARRPRFDAFLRPVLDAMQTMPAFVYLIPVLLFFGVGRVPGVVATVIFALAPAIRLTALGLKQVQPVALEAAKSFGSTSRQTLLKVELPLALPTIMTGVNQTIMLALGIVVIAALIGAGGLGKEVTNSLQRLKVGDGFEAGMAIVFLAILLDRLSDAVSKFDFTFVDGRYPKVSPALQAPTRWLGQFLNRFRHYATDDSFEDALRPYAFLINGLLVTLILLVIGLIFGITKFPSALNIRLDIPVDWIVAWMRDNLFQIGNLPIGTGPLSDFITLGLMNPLRDLLTKILPWPVVIFWAAALAFRVGGWRLGLLAAIGLLCVGFLGMWATAMDTLSQVIIAIIFTVAIAVPLGILTSRSDRAQAILRPLLDTLQTIPPFVYLVPVIMLFNIGRVPGLIASVLYALAPGIKLVDLGIRQVPGETVEAAQAFGSTETQTLVNVKLPLALPAILVGINQMIMMVLSMVVIAGMVGGAGLGLEALTGLARGETGRGIESGLAIVAIAIIIDRITQALAAEK